MHRSWPALAFVAALTTTGAAIAQTSTTAPEPPQATTEQRQPDAAPNSASEAISATQAEPLAPAAKTEPGSTNTATAPAPQVPAPSAQEPTAAATEPKSSPTAAAAGATPATSATITGSLGGSTGIATALKAQISAAPAAKADRDDQAALAAFYETRAHAPVWTDSGKGFNDKGRAVIDLIKTADDWGLKLSAFELPEGNSNASDEQLAADDIKLTAAVLKYARHARGGRLDPANQLSRNFDRKPPVLAPAAVLDGMTQASDAATYLKSLHPQHAQFERLRQLYATARTGTAPTDKAMAQRLLVNMEQWRWMPRDLGRFHVSVNIPEYTIRVMRDGQPIHTERVIVGKTDTQTPLFSDEMEQVIFHPFWGVPESIKTKEILPGLVKSGQSALARNNLRIQYRGRDIDPATVDWTQTDIRNFHVYQPPGSGNVLGVVKFRFPNKHDVYMHDTPSKSLFNSTVRTFSHGCMRVRNPLRLAELILAEDKSWPASRVAASVAGSKQDEQINLTTKFPVHITYFTAWVGEDGKLQTFADIYGHETRVALGLDGKFNQINRQIETAKAAPVGRLVEIKQTASNRDWMKNVFNNN